MLRLGRVVAPDLALCSATGVCLWGCCVLDGARPGLATGVVAELVWPARPRERLRRAACAAQRCTGGGEAARRRCVRRATPAASVAGKAVRPPPRRGLMWLPWGEWGENVDGEGERAPRRGLCGGLSMLGGGSRGEWSGGVFVAATTGILCLGESTQRVHGDGTAMQRREGGTPV